MVYTWLLCSVINFYLKFCGCVSFQTGPSKWSFSLCILDICFSTVDYLWTPEATLAEEHFPLLPSKCICFVFLFRIQHIWIQQVNKQTMLPCSTEYSLNFSPEQFSAQKHNMPPNVLFNKKRQQKGTKYMEEIHFTLKNILYVYYWPDKLITCSRFPNV